MFDLIGRNWAMILRENEGGGSGGEAPAADAGGDAGAAAATDAPADGGQDGGDQSTQTIAGQVFGKENEGGEDNPEGEKPAGDDAGKEAPAEPYASKIPEGMESFGDQYAAYDTAANNFLTENPGASARDALAWAAENQSNQVKEAGKALRAQFETTISGWETQAKADPDLGGANFDGTLKDYGAGLKAFGSPALIEVLNESGLGSHPEVIRAFAKIGKASQESPVLGGEGGKGNVSFADTVYGNKKG